MNITTKTIRSKGASFIFRLSLNHSHGSLKAHLIASDDKDEPHTHPWDYRSFLLVPYKEVVRDGNGWKCLRHLPFSVVRRKHNEEHGVRLYRVLGLPIPALTIGLYTKKLTLCSFCKNLGYCKEQGPPKKP